jgi:hypothetical protein
MHEDWEKKRGSSEFLQQEAEKKKRREGIKDSIL